MRYRTAARVRFRRWETCCGGTEQLKKDDASELGGQLFHLEGDDEVWRMLEEDAFEWSAQYNDYLVHYYDSAEEDPETHTSVWCPVAEECYGARGRGFARVGRRGGACRSQWRYGAGRRAGKEEEEVGEGWRCIAVLVVYRATVAWIVLLLVQNNLDIEHTSLLGDRH